MARTKWRLIGLALAALPTLLAPLGARAALIYESAGTGPGYTGDSLVISHYADPAPQWVGTRFHLEDPVEVTAVGGRIVVCCTGDAIFAAIVALPSSGGLPPWNPLDIEQRALAATLIPASDANVLQDLVVPLSVTLAPGDYGLVFGSGFFGALWTTAGGVGAGSPETPGATFFRAGFPPDVPSAVWQDSPSAHGWRFAIEGLVVPEPATACLLGLGILGLTARRRSGNADRVAG